MYVLWEYNARACVEATGITSGVFFFFEMKGPLEFVKEAELDEQWASETCLSLPP